MAVGILLLLDTIILLIKTSSRNLGIFMPAVLGAPLVAAAILAIVKPEFFLLTIGKITKWTLIAGYAAFTLLFSVTSLLAFSAGHAAPVDDADVLIVLGCGIKGTKPTLTLSRRLDKAIEYLNANENTKVILSGGQGNGEIISEAQAMSRYMTEHGIPQQRIITEDKSESTEENFAYSKEIIDEMYPEGASVCYVTTYFHVYRAGKVAKKCGIDAQGFGAPGVWYITFNDYLRECVGITMYLLTGKI